MIRSRGGDREAENSFKFLSGRSIALRRPGRAVAISMTPQLAGRRSAALWEAPLPCHLPPAALGLGGGSAGPARSSLGRARAGRLRAAQGHSAGSPPARPDPPRAAQTGSLPSAAPRGPLPPHGGAGPGDPSKGARPSRHCRSPPAPQASLPAGPEPPRPRTHRRGDSLPPPAGPGQAHVRARLPRRRYATMAARAELGSVPPSCRASAPRGGGDCHGPIRAAGPARAARVRGGPAAVLRALRGAAALGRPGDADPTRRGAASELGWLRGRCGRRETR